MDDDIRAPALRGEDFLGAFAVVERQDRILMVQNRRAIGGAEVTTWDLPGGQVEPGELLPEALARELREETGLAVVGQPRFLFVQEGERVTGAVRRYAWRSFFFAVEAVGAPVAGAEILDVRWFARGELPAALHAPYHDSFQRWLERGGGFHASGWRD
ncbi:MAG: NUDIX hydrolase [Planctomycetota bacterium]